MLASGVPRKTIAALLKIDEDTLAKHFAAELEDGGERALSKASGTLYLRGIKGDTTALIFYLKTRGRGRFKETQDLNVSITGDIAAEKLADRIGALAATEAGCGNPEAPPTGA